MFLTKVESKNKKSQNLKNFSRPSRYFLGHQKIAKKSIAKKYFLLFPYPISPLIILYQDWKFERHQKLKSRPTLTKQINLKFLEEY